jgi:hypothetical protein
LKQQASPFAFDRATFYYDPYPIGLISQVFERSYYRDLVGTFPALELFRFMQYHGDKYSLSELNHPRQYHDFLASTPCWKALHAYVKSPRFIPDVLGFLQRHEIDLNIPRDAFSPARRSLRRTLLSLLGSRPKTLTSRFEFSAMPASGGSILPHTDSPQKLITLVMSMRDPAEWSDAYGGSTDVMRPKEPSKSFNFVNKYLSFDDVEVVRKMPFDENQCIIFVKTFNSLHGVLPMTGPANIFRRTLTINIESTTPW